MKHFVLLFLTLISPFVCSKPTRINSRLVLVSSVSEPFYTPQDIINTLKIYRYYLTLSYKKDISEDSETEISISHFKKFTPHQKTVLRFIHVTAEY